MRLSAQAGDLEAFAKYEQHLSKLQERNQKYRQKIQKAREADQKYLRQLNKKERIRQEKLLETKHKRSQRSAQKAKMTRAEQLAALKTKEAKQKGA